MTLEKISNERLQELEDRLALADLVNAYATAADSRDYDAFHSNYAPISSVTIYYPDGSKSESLDNDAFKGGRVFNDPPPFLRTMHVMTNHRCEITGDTATGSCYCIAHHISQGDGHENNLVAHLRYEDDYVRTAEGWKFRSRVLRILFIENRPCAPLSPPAQ